MFFDVSLRGHATVKTLCIIDKLEKIGDALVGEAIKVTYPFFKPRKLDLHHAKPL